MFQAKERSISNFLVIYALHRPEDPSLVRILHTDKCIVSLGDATIALALNRNCRYCRIHNSEDGWDETAFTPNFVFKSFTNMPSDWKIAEDRLLNYEYPIYETQRRTCSFLFKLRSHIFANANSKYVYYVPFKTSMTLDPKILEVLRVPWITAFISFALSPLKLWHSDLCSHWTSTPNSPSKTWWFFGFAKCLFLFCTTFPTYCLHAEKRHAMSTRDDLRLNDKNFFWPFWKQNYWSSLWKLFHVCNSPKSLLPMLPRSYGTFPLTKTIWLKRPTIWKLIWFSERRQACMWCN